MILTKDMIIYPTLFLIIFFAGFSDATTDDQDADQATKPVLGEQHSQTKP